MAAAAFAHDIWHAFEVDTAADDGALAPANEDALSFMRRNIFNSGCVSDLLLHPTRTNGDGAWQPALRSLTGGTQPSKGGIGNTVVEALERELLIIRAREAALLRSTSWRVTAPLRVLKQKIWPV